MLRVLSIAVICLMLSGCSCCGFQLRGQHTIPSYLKTVYISPNEPFQPFQRALRAKLNKYHVTIACEPGPNVTTIALREPAITEQALAVGPDGQVQRYKYSYSITYTVSTEDVSYQRTITRSRELSRNNNQLLSDESERQTINRELTEEAVNELLRRITSGPPHTVTSDVVTDNNPC